MNNQYFEFRVGEGGGSINQPSGITWSGRGLGDEQEEPLAMWWIKRLKAEYSADGSLLQSYRRSKWGQPANTERENRIAALKFKYLGITLSFLLALASSLNVVAHAQMQSESKALSQSKLSIQNNEKAATERFSMLAEFAEKHKQVLNLSKLSEFTWSEDGPITAHKHKSKSSIHELLQPTESIDANAAQAEESKMKTDSATRFRASSENSAATGQRALIDKITPTDKNLK